MQARNLFIGNENEGVFNNRFHFIGVCNHISGSIATVKLHTFNSRKLRIHRLAFFYGDNAVFTNNFHCFCNKGAYFRATCRDCSRLLNSFIAFNGLGNALQVRNRCINSLFNTFLQDDRVCARGKVFQPFAHNRLRQNNSSRRTVTSNVVGFRRYFFYKLRAHVFKGISKLDFFCNSNTVVGDKGSAVFLVKHNVSALRAKRNFNSISEYVHTSFKGFSCVFAVFDLFCHNILTPSVQIFSLPRLREYRFA